MVWHLLSRFFFKQPRPVAYVKLEIGIIVMGKRKEEKMMRTFFVVHTTKMQIDIRIVDPS